MSALFKKPSNMRWVDLAIWIDENFYKDDCDYNTAYAYMYLLASMLSSKHRYFDNQKDYDEFASLLAYDTFKRMSNVNKGKIKSVLNYMKSIISFRRIGYNFTKRQKIIDPVYDKDWDAVSYVENCKNSYEASFSDKLSEGVVDILSYTPQYIKESIPKIFKIDKVLYKNIYLSCMLSLIDRITLPNIRECKLNTKLNSSSMFDEVKYYNKYLEDGEIILWNISKEYSNLVIVVLNKVQNIIINEIKELSNDFKVSNDEFSNIMSSGFTHVRSKDETNS